MKILAIGDFHGKFPRKFEKIIKKEKIDAVVSVGDYPSFHYRDLFFKHCFGKGLGLWEVIGKKKYKELLAKDLKMGEKVLKKLDKLKIPVFTVLGNVDYPLHDDVAHPKIPRGKRYYKPEWSQHKNFLKILKKYKNIKRFDYSYFRFGDFVFIGMRGHSSPGKVKSKGFRKHKEILNKLFKRFRNENKEGRVIFVSHVPPKDTKLDKIGMKAHPKVRGTHRGSKLARRIIEKHQPVLNLCGHTHEAWGKGKIRKTLCVNTGAVVEGRGA